jgi:uncharacterized protein with FMN-binding domain
MKRALLIAGGTVGGLGAVLAITPPQISSSSSSVALGSGTAPAGVSGATQATTAAATTTTAAAPAATKSSTTTKSANATATKSATAKATASASASTSASASASATPSATKTTAPATKNVTGTFIGDAINVGYGIVQVQITVNNGKITDAQAVQAPSGRNDRFTQMSVPVLRQKTLAAQGSNITGVSGASYTSYGWYKSLVSALAKAGLSS